MPLSELLAEPVRRTQSPLKITEVDTKNYRGQDYKKCREPMAEEVAEKEAAQLAAEGHEADRMRLLALLATCRQPIDAELGQAFAVRAAL